MLQKLFKRVGLGAGATEGSQALKVGYDITADRVLTGGPEIATFPQNTHLGPDMHPYNMKCEYFVCCAPLFWWKLQWWGCNELL